MVMKKCLLLLMFLGFFFGASAAKQDSIGTKVKNGKVYILHRVEKGQGLYTISKKYGVSLQDLIKENPGSEEVIRVDQIIWVPTNLPAKLEEPVVEDYFDQKHEEPSKEDPPSGKKSTFAQYHTVISGETLYGISVKYSTTVDVIKSLNNLESDLITEGQKLLVPAKAGTVEATPDDSMDTVEGELHVVQSQITVDDPVEMAPPDNDSTVSNTSPQGYTIKVIKLADYNLEKVEEEGRVSVDGEDLPEGKHFAYHFSATVGTVIMVTNPETNQTVFVKVIGNFERSDSSDEIIRLSPYSAESVGLTNDQLVELSYAR